MSSGGRIELPSFIGPYKVEGVLGRGASGVVYRVRDPALERSVALKLLTDDLDEEAQARFTIEAKAAARIIHPNVVQVFSVGEHEGRAYITQELIEGYPLSSLLEVRGQLSAGAAQDIAIQAATGLSAAADVGVLHRDVKPQNLLVTDQGLLKLADFGLAKILGAPSELTDTGTTLGTPHYMSPEQGQGAELDHRADQYSLGATLYHLLTGAPPFDSDNALTLLLKHLQDDLPPIANATPDCPIPLAQVVERMLSKKREDRFETFDALIEALEETLDEETAERGEAEIKALISEASHQVEAAQTPPQRRMKEQLLVLGAAAAAVAVIGVAQFDRAAPQTTLASKVPTNPRLNFKPAMQIRAASASPEVQLKKRPTKVKRKPKSSPKASMTNRLIVRLSQAPSKAERAARTLGLLGDHRATAPLIRALTSKHENVAVAAAWALGELGDIQAIEPLARVAKDGRSASLRDAAEKAGRRLWSVEEK